MELYNNDCLEVMRDLSANSIDLLFCDLPYGQTSCKWDCKIDLTLFWKEVNRICKKECPMFFTTTTRFGVDLINSNPTNFRYDLVWVKSAGAGFLNAKKMPLRKHEMIYVFYRKLPLYDLTSHSHKFLNDYNEIKSTTANEVIYRKDLSVKHYNNNGIAVYDPPLPNSVIKEEKNECYGEGSHNSEYIGEARKANVYEPPLPNSVITTKLREDVNGLYGTETKKIFIYENGKLKNSEPRYDPPLPNSVIKQQLTDTQYGDISVLKHSNRKDRINIYEPPLPNSILEIKSQRGKHSTQKPTALIEWILKYYSKEGDTVLDPTMGSGSTGVACKIMKRNFIGIEKDEKIYKSAFERLNIII